MVEEKARENIIEAILKSNCIVTVYDDSGYIDCAFLSFNSKNISFINPKEHFYIDDVANIVSSINIPYFCFEKRFAYFYIGTFSIGDIIVKSDYCINKNPITNPIELLSVGEAFFDNKFYQCANIATITQWEQIKDDEILIFNSYKDFDAADFFEKEFLKLSKNLKTFDSKDTIGKFHYVEKLCISSRKSFFTFTEYPNNNYQFCYHYFENDSYDVYPYNGNKCEHNNWLSSCIQFASDCLNKILE